MGTANGTLRTHHILSLFMIALAIAMTACQSKSGYQGGGAGSAQGPQIEKQKLTPISAERLEPAKQLLKNLAATVDLESLYLKLEPTTESDLSRLDGPSRTMANELLNRCNFQKSKTEPKIEADKVRVGAQFDFSRNVQAQGEACPLEMSRHIEANLTYWSLDAERKSGTIRTRGEIQQKTRFHETAMQSVSGYRELDMKFRLIEDGQLSGAGKSHIRIFGGGHMILSNQGRVALRVRVEQLKDQARSAVVVRVRAKKDNESNFDYAVQLEVLAGEIKINKAYIGDVPLTDGEIRDLKVANLVGRFILSVQ